MNTRSPPPRRELQPSLGGLPGVSFLAAETLGRRQPTPCRDALPTGSDLHLEPAMQRGHRRAQPFHFCHQEQAGWERGPARPFLYTIQADAKGFFPSGIFQGCSPLNVYRQSAWRINFHVFLCQAVWRVIITVQIHILIQISNSADI